MNSHEYYFEQAAKQARKATCLRRLCGTVVVSQKGDIIGTGFNSPVAGLESQRRCEVPKSDLDSKVTDKTCCMHAEQRAILESIQNKPSDLEGSTLYFASVDAEGEMLRSRHPYCTICSKMALEAGIGYFALWHEDGIRLYGTEEYNLLSYQYSEATTEPKPLP